MATDELEAYLDEAVSRAVGNPPQPVLAGPRSASSTDPRRSDSRTVQRVALKLANNRAGGALRAVTGSAEHIRALRSDVEAMSEAHHHTRLAVETALRRLDDISWGVENRLRAVAGAIAGLELTTNELRTDLETIDTALVDSLDAEVEEFDAFYADFEERFRGSADEIRQRSRQWLPYVGSLPGGGAPALDIACGRGEWLGLLAEQGVTARGVDLNTDFVDMCIANGLDVVYADAFDYLESVSEPAYHLITAFQFVEHIQPAELLRLLRLSYRALRPGGALILETPNPSNLRVAAFAFYLDPTHRRPVHPEFLRFAVERTGFVDLETVFANPAADQPALEGLEEIMPEGPAALLQHTAWALFGPQDYAIIARKPSD